MIKAQTWRVKIRSPISKRWYTAIVYIEEYKAVSDSYILSFKVEKSFLLFFTIKVKVMTIPVETKDIIWLEKIA